MISKSLQFRSKKECACDSVSCGIWKHLSMTTYAVSGRERRYRRLDRKSQKEKDQFNVVPYFKAADGRVHIEAAAPAK